MAKRKRTPMSAEHKKALAAGREEGRTVRNYLQALETNRPRRGRKRTPESIKRRLTKIDQDLESASPLQRLQLTQERIDLGHELDRLSVKVDNAGLEKGFVKVAKKYSQRKGISYAAWRELGVPPDVLRRSGVTRSGA